MQITFKFHILTVQYLVANEVNAPSCNLNSTMFFLGRNFLSSFLWIKTPKTKKLPPPKPRFFQPWSRPSAVYAKVCCLLCC